MGPFLGLSITPPPSLVLFDYTELNVGDRIGVVVQCLLWYCISRLYLDYLLISIF